MITPVEKLPKRRFWQLATSATGNLPTQKSFSVQCVTPAAELRAGNLATSVWQFGNSKKSGDFNSLGKLPDCRNFRSPYGRDERAPVRRARPSRLGSSAAVLATSFQPVLVTGNEPGALLVSPGHGQNGSGAMLALDLGTTTGWAMRLATGHILSGSVSFRPSRFDGGGMRYVRFAGWLDSMADDAAGLAAIYFEEVRRHLGIDAAHLYGGFLATLTAWCEHRGIAYQGVPVGTIKRHATAKGNAGKDAVIAAVTARGFNPKDDNEADAIALLLWAIETQGGVR
jgi:hypothetical protein